MALRIYKVALELVRRLRPVIERIRERDPNLAQQFRDALTSIPLNLSEGSYSQGRNVRARFYNALGSAGEVRSCLDVAEAFGYIEPVDDETLDMLDHLIATVYRLSK